MQEFLMKDNEGIFYELKESNMKTAMQELMDWTFHFQDEMISANEVIIKAHKLLEKEKEQIIEAYDRGYKACDLDEALEINKTMFSGERHYNQTYNQNK
jgi:hypothetical protein